MADYGRALLLKDHGVDWHTLTTVREYVAGFAGLGYEFAPLFDGWNALFGAEAEVFLGRAARPDIVARLRAPALLVSLAAAPAPAAAGD
jgi:hypothetical protein